MLTKPASADFIMAAAQLPDSHPISHPSVNSWNKKRIVLRDYRQRVTALIMSIVLVTLV